MEEFSKDRERDNERMLNTSTSPIESYPNSFFNSHNEYNEYENSNSKSSGQKYINGQKVISYSKKDREISDNYSNDSDKNKNSFIKRLFNGGEEENYFEEESSSFAFDDSYEKYERLKSRISFNIAPYYIIEKVEELMWISTEFYKKRMMDIKKGRIYSYKNLRYKEMAKKAKPNVKKFNVIDSKVVNYQINPIKHTKEISISEENGQISYNNMVTSMENLLNNKRHRIQSINNFLTSEIFFYKKKKNEDILYCNCKGFCLEEKCRCFNNAKACNYFCSCFHCKNNGDFINIRTFKLLKLAFKNKNNMNKFRNLLEEENYFKKNCPECGWINCICQN